MNHHRYNGMPTAQLGEEGWHKPWSGGNCGSVCGAGVARGLVRQLRDPAHGPWVHSEARASAFPMV
ncbi:DUF397 domain-containing protein [Streptomyces sp. NBC_00885]|uniref:DUF397 domain-containing protein n=1 Tax=Streptomyces sp. NBC_00885 TaxID=2975857 RepID=UPI003862F651